MPFINFNETPHQRIMDGIHGALHHSEQLTFGHIVLEQGAILPQHHHMQEQWTHVLDGQLQFTLDGETQMMTQGMSVHIPSNVPHSAVALTKCKVIDGFMPVREDFKTLDIWVNP